MIAMFVFFCYVACNDMYLCNVACNDMYLCNVACNDMYLSQNFNQCLPRVTIKCVVAMATIIV